MGALALLAGAAAGSCGGGRQGEAKEPPAAASPVAAAETREALPEVEAPPGTFLWGRIKSPEGLAASLAQAAGLPRETLDLLPLRLSEVLPAADLAAPIEIAVAVHPSPSQMPLGVVSFGVTSEQAVLAELARADVLVEEAPGGTHTFRIGGGACVLGPAAGVLPARVACGEEPQAVELLGDYALRGLSRQALSEAEAHVEFVAAPLQRVYGRQVGAIKVFAPMAVRQLQIDHPRFDRAVADAVFGLVDEALALSEDLDGARLQVWNRGGDYEVSLSGRVRKGSSWFAETLHAMGQRQTIPPAWFWTLPSSTSAAFFSQSAPEASSREVWKVLTGVVLGYLESEGLTAASSQRLESWLGTVSELGGTHVSASGPVVPSATGTGEGPAWQLVGVQREAPGYKKLLDELVALLAERDVRKLAGEGVEWLPSLKRRGALPRQPSSVVVEWEASRSPSSLLDHLGELSALGGGLPLSSGSRPAEATEKQKGFFAIVPDGERTWFAWADSLERLAEPFAAMSGEGTPRLKKITGLGALQESPSFLTGFVKLERLFEASSSGGVPGARWDRISGSLPHGGQVPLTFEIRVTGGEPVEVELRQRIPRELVADAARAFMAR